MPIDRFGQPITMGWQEHEILWLYAANSLRASERQAALKDIASMTSRTLLGVQMKAKRLQERTREEARKTLSESLGAGSRRLFVSAPTLTGHKLDGRSAEPLHDALKVAAE